MRTPAATLVALAGFLGAARADDFSNMPPPGEESGRIDDGEGESTARKIGRGILVVPRAAVEIVFAPVRAGVYVYDRYQLKERWMQIFFTEDRTTGVYPTLQIESGYGLNLGARVVRKDLFAFRAATGGRFNSRYTLDLTSGARLGDRLTLRARGDLEKRPQDRFFGIGNEGMGIETRHSQDLQRAWLTADVRTFGALNLMASGAVTELDYGPGETGTSIEMVYDPSMLTGFTTGMRHVYGEVELRWDTRRRADRWDPLPLPATGSFIAGYAGRVHQLADSGGDYTRYGVMLQRYVWLGRGPRVLSLRFNGNAVTGGYEDVAFSELPQLGGNDLLRGYPTDRFRDRVAAVGTVEYQWDLNRNLSASLFVDAGQVFPSITDVGDIDNLRVGYGIGFQAVTEKSFVAAANIATSIDGGLFFNLAFDPAFDLDPRVDQR